jgi:hypothetical protein
MDDSLPWQARQFFAFLGTVTDGDDSDRPYGLGEPEHKAHSIVVKRSYERRAQTLIDSRQHQKHCGEGAIHDTVKLFATPAITLFRTPSIRNDDDYPRRFRQIVLTHSGFGKKFLCVLISNDYSDEGELYWDGWGATSVCLR